MNSSNSVIITAAGHGKRMGSQIPKQFLPICGRPILMHTITRFYDFDAFIEIILTLPVDWVDYWDELCVEYGFNIPHRVVTGGVKRFESVKNAINHATGDLIAIHDGVRPLVTVDTIKRCFESAQILKAAIPAVRPNTVLRIKTEDGSEKVSREEIVSTQTPQVFQRGILIRAYKQEYAQIFSDDASVVENLGISIHVVEGNDENIQITTKKDIKYAEDVLLEWNSINQ
jgi:2-C-methyl-D-erythritol 4-phosphate cytidylyltransferase